jgi:hypothetical protein
MPTCGRGYAAAGEPSDDPRGIRFRAAAEPHQRSAQHDGIPSGGVEPGAALLHLSNEHVGHLTRSTEQRFGLAVLHTGARATPASDRPSRAGEAARQDIDIGQRAVTPTTHCLDNEVLGNREVPVDPEVRLNDRYGVIHDFRLGSR